MRLFLSILSFFFCLVLGAQELSVKSFEPNTRDLSARTYPRMDSNDVPCALVKVQLASAGAVFEGSVVGKAEYKTSEYWVYMPKGTKRLNVKLEGYLPLPVEFDALESSTTYILTITGVKTGGQQQEVRTKTGWIILESEPQGAAVYINDEFVGNTPLESYKQPYGTYQYRVEKLNYHSTSGTVELNSAQFEKTVKLLPAFGSISVAGGIAGATVLLDGRSTGKQSPCTLTEIPSGAHVVTLQKDKYAPQQFNVTVEDGKEAKVSANLNARFAAITVKTLQGADILIDNATKGSTSCTIDLMEGYHDVEVRLAHHKKATKQIQVVAGQSQTIDLKPTPIYGSLDVTSTPRNATITIDGKKYGKTPFTIEDLLEGEHTVTISLDGYASETKRVTISEGKAASLAATLQSGRDITISTVEANAIIYIDGKKAGKSPYTGNLSIGSHTVYAKIDGEKVYEKTINSEKGSGPLPDIILGYEYVDLGLSVKWATCNVGADNPEDYGDYYAWGEVETKDYFDEDTYKWYDSGYTKYCRQWEGAGKVIDNKTTLDPWDDVAHVKWGGKWRMPTKAERDELCDTNNCTWTWTTQGGKKGYQVTSKKNGNSIFLPAAGLIFGLSNLEEGCGCYWTCTRNFNMVQNAMVLFFNSSGVGDIYKERMSRHYGLPVRPVYP